MASIATARSPFSRRSPLPTPIAPIPATPVPTFLLDESIFDLGSEREMDGLEGIMRFPKMAFPRGTATPPRPEPVPTGPAPTPAPTPVPFSSFNPSAILQFLRGLGSPSTAALQANFQKLLEQGLIPSGSYLENKATADEIFIPGYGWWDTLVGADTGSPSAWQFAQSGDGGGFGGFGGGGSFFDDPLLQGYTDVSLQAIQRLLQPQAMNPVLQDAITRLQALGDRRNPGYEQLQTIANRRLGQLREPLFGLGADASPEALQRSALLRTQFVEPLVNERAAAEQRALERASARGLGLTSGLTEELSRDIDREFGRNLATTGRDLALYEVEANEGREQEAIQIGQLLASLGLSEVPTQLGATSQLASIGQGLQGDEIRNLLSGVGVAQNLSQLPFQSLGAVAGLTNLLGGQPIPQADSLLPIVQLLAFLAGQGEDIFNKADEGNAAFWKSIFQMLPGLFQPRTTSG